MSPLISAAHRAFTRSVTAALFTSGGESFVSPPTPSRIRSAQRSHATTNANTTRDLPRAWRSPPPETWLSHLDCPLVSPVKRRMLAPEDRQPQPFALRRRNPRVKPNK